MRPRRKKETERRKLGKQVEFVNNPESVDEEEKS